MNTGNAVRFAVEEIEFFERPVTLRMPFRFGVVTLTEAPQLFVSVRVSTPDGRDARGMSAFLLAPKWFDKNPALSNEDNFDQLRRSARAAADAYLGGREKQTAWGLFSAHYDDLRRDGATRGLNPLVVAFGQAAMDAAIIDALGRRLSRSFYQLVQTNALGLQVNSLIGDLAGFDLNRWLASLEPAAQVAARHTVGMVDPISGHPATVGDGLPESLSEVITRYGHRHFKLKVSGMLSADIDRLVAIAAVLDTLEGDYLVSLDGNEQYEAVDQVVELWRAIEAHPQLERLCRSVHFIEQPIMRKQTSVERIDALAQYRPVIIDESDDSLDSFPQAVDLGYRGVSSKLCKGVYKSIINAARCHRLSESVARDGRSGSAYFMSGEDLTNQAGLAVQQDLALANLLGITHVERNGHHYVNGMAGVPLAEQQDFVRAHPDLYQMQNGVARLQIQAGQLSVGSLDCPGFASAVLPDTGRVLRPRADA